MTFYKDGKKVAKVNPKKVQKKTYFQVHRVLDREHGLLAYVPYGFFMHILQTIMTSYFTK